MKIELKKDFTWSLVVPTSMGVRITPLNGQPVHCAETFHMQVTSAESNVVSVSSYLGLPVKVLTTFVKDSPIARLIKDNLASRHIVYEGVEVEQGGPWGYRHQFNIADSGYGSRGPRVQNDRPASSGPSPARPVATSWPRPPSRSSAKPRTSPSPPRSTASSS